MPVTNMASCLSMRRTMNPKTILAFAIVTLFATANFAHPVCAQGFSTLRRGLKHHYKVGHIRIFYDIEGDHAVKPTDVNKNDIPDQVEDLMSQTWCAHYIFVDTLGFPSPIKSERYQKAEYLDINFLAKKTLGLSGSAYDGLQRFRREMDDDETRAICFDVGTNVIPHKNPTPTHEYFHLIQYSMTYFKPRWYLEGMARWSEHAVSKDGIGKMKYKGPWPHDQKGQDELFKMTYDTQYHLWNPLARRIDKKGKIPVTDASKMARQLRYANGKQVLKDFKLNGAEFIKAVLVRLGEYDDIAKEELGFKTWAEKNQKSLKNSPYIYKAVMEVAREHGQDIGEFKIRGSKVESLDYSESKEAGVEGDKAKGQKKKAANS